MKKAAIALMVLFCSVAVLAAPIEWWDMNDAAGTDLNDLSNSGTIGSVWNFNTVGAVTDGNGLFVIGGDSGTTTRKLPKKGTATAEPTGTVDTYATPITAGAYSLVVDFAAWNFDAGSLGDVWKLKAQNSSGADIAGIELGMDSATTARIRMWTTGDGGSYYRAFGFNLAEAAGAMAEVRFDFDNDTVAYMLDGVEQYSWSDFNGVDIGGMVYTSSGDGTADWATAASSVSIEAMGIDVIPEPATLGMITASSAAIIFIRRRFVI